MVGARISLVPLIRSNDQMKMLSVLYNCTHCVSATGWSELDSHSPVSRSVHFSGDTAAVWRFSSPEALPAPTASFWTVFCASCSCVGALGAGVGAGICAGG